LLFKGAFEQQKRLLVGLGLGFEVADFAFFFEFGALEDVVFHSLAGTIEQSCGGDGERVESDDLVFGIFKRCGYCGDRALIGVHITYSIILRNLSSG
jgi:hypothetical protein